MTDFFSTSTPSNVIPFASSKNSANTEPDPLTPQGIKVMVELLGDNMPMHHAHPCPRIKWFPEPNENGCRLYSTPANLKYLLDYFCITVRLNLMTNELEYHTPDPNFPAVPESGRSDYNLQPYL